MFLIRLVFVCALFFITFDQTTTDKPSFISPVRIPLQISANFGELRIDHFHSGLDIKTQGATGKEVVATADGYIYRIGVSSGGFGKALYVRHPSGYSTVYGHLERFTPEIEKYVKDQQYEKESFLITLFPSKEEFSVKQGDLIAYSGNSGSSGGPHLHYEIRKSDNEVPVNPLLFDFGISDNIKPVIEKLVIYPVNNHTIINNHNSVKKINVMGSNGNYYIPAENEINISGLAGFGIKSFDQLNDSYNKCSVYSIELIIDSVSIFKYVMDSFSFNESRYINSHIDYETYMKESSYIERTYILPNDKLSTYKKTIKRGIFDFNDEKAHSVRIIVKDVQNNKSTLSFQVKSQLTKPQFTAQETDKNLILMPFNRTNRFETEKVSVNIPTGALYDTLYFSYKSSPGTSEMLSDVHTIHNIFTPVNKPFTLSIKPGLIPAGKESKMLIIQWVDDQKKNAMNSSWTGDCLTTESLTFGTFYVGIDTIAPVISANGLVSGVDLRGKKELNFRITDELSGIKSYDPVIDGKWALFEYDQKNNLLIYQFDENRIAKGTKHNLSLKVTDNKDNTSEFNSEFIW